MNARTLGLLTVAFCLLFLAGCDESLPVEYGKRSGFEGPSVNGTSVFARMFEAAGHNVRSVRALTPKLQERGDVIVWFPDDFGPPSEEVRTWLENWLDEDDQRMLIYVGRDYDAATDYWRAVEPLAPPTEREAIRARRLEAEAMFASERSKGPSKSTDFGWFEFHPEVAPRDVRTLDGDPTWTQDVDPAKLGIRLNGRFRPKRRTIVVLESEGDPLVMRRPHKGIILVTNGSFLLNAPLVNHEHRKLAARLIQEIGVESRDVVFLESGEGGPSISESEPKHQELSGLAIFGVEPFSTILLQWAAVGLIFCFVRFPIFGRPRPWIVSRQTDFGRHIEALGSLLRRTRDRAFALGRVQHYHHGHDSGPDHPTSNS